MKAWSPDGTALAYDLAPTFGYATPVKAVDMNGQTRAISTTLGESVVQLAPAYARTGGWVYFSAIPPGGADVFRLYRVQADGSGTEQLAYEGAEDDFFPSVSPDGTHLVYVRRTGAGMDYMRVLDITRGVVSRIDVPGHSPAWSPTGDEIAYVDVRSDGVIRAMKPDGSGIRQVSATNARYQRGLTWSSDGRWIVARNDGTNRLDLIEAASGRTLPLPFTAGMHFPAWKP
jgi:Tol biopolymer transport system component